MLLLTFFAFLAGLATIAAPCVLPILPAVLSAGIPGSKQRPLGIVVGLIVSFSFFTLALSFLTAHLGISPNVLRGSAIIILFLFGLLLLIPQALARFEAALSSLIPQSVLAKIPERGDFLGGLLVGISLGLVWTPCVGPILATVISVAATSGASLSIFVLILAYSTGAAIPLLLLIYGGQILIKRARLLSHQVAKLQLVFGLILIATAVAMFFGVDRTVQASLVAKLPNSISNGLTEGIEESKLVQDQLVKIKNQPAGPSLNTVVSQSGGLPVLSPAPELTGITHWLNSDPLTLAGLKGKVVLIDFWTYSCINCIRTLPHLNSWYDTYKSQGLVIIGVHAPEFAFEKDTANVQAAINQYGIHYPVAQDNNFATWDAYSNQYWPAEYLIDANGNLRATNFGEGNYIQSEQDIRSLLEEAQHSKSLATNAPVVADTTPNQAGQSPETYLGSARRSGFTSKSTDLPLNGWSLTGDWLSNDQSISSSSAGATISYHFQAKDVYLVMSPPANTSTQVEVLLDGKPIGSEGGADVKNGMVKVDSARLYHLVHLDSVTPHVVILKFSQPGSNAFAFTFG